MDLIVAGMVAWGASMRLRMKSQTLLRTKVRRELKKQRRKPVGREDNGSYAQREIRQAQTLLPSLQLSYLHSDYRLPDYMSPCYQLPFAW